MKAWNSIEEIHDYFDRVREERLNDTGRFAVDQARDLAIRCFHEDSARVAASVSNTIDKLLNTARKSDEAASAQDMRRLKEYQDKKKAAGTSLRAIK